MSHLVLDPEIDKNSFRHQNSIPHLRDQMAPKLFIMYILVSASWRIVIWCFCGIIFLGILKMKSILEMRNYNLRKSFCRRKAALGPN